MRYAAYALLGALGLALIGLVSVLAFAGGANVTVVSISNVDSESLRDLSEVYPIKPGVYCDLDACCAGHGGAIQIYVQSGAVQCADGERPTSEQCSCPARARIALTGDER